MRPNGMIIAALLATSAGSGLAADKKIDAVVVNGQIEVPDQEAKVKKVDKTVTWELKTTGYLFPANGIVIDAPADTFSQCRPISGGVKFQCKKDKHQSLARYKYIVNVSKDGVALTPLDPFINLE